MTANGTVIENNRTLPYGEAWLPTDNGATSTNDKKFTTYQRDAESGLDYAMNRYDASSYGRFVSPDKGKMYLELPITLNRYVYTSDDPINNVDPTGMECPYSVCVTTPPPIDPLTELMLNGIGGFSSGLDPSAMGCVQCYLAALWALQNPGPTPQQIMQQRWDMAQAIGLPVGLIGQNGTFNGADQEDQVVTSLVAMRQRFLNTDCAKTLGFDSGQAAVDYLKNVSFNYEPNASLTTGQHALCAFAEGCGIDGKIYISANGIAKQGNAFDFILLHELWHLVAPDKTDYIDSDAGKNALKTGCQTVIP